MRLAGSLERQCLRSRTKPPDQAAAHDKQKRDQLRARHHASENFAAARIVAQEFEQIPGYAVQKQVSAEDLAIKFLAAKQPHQQHEVRQLHRRFEQLGRFERNSERGSNLFVSKLTGEGDSPEMMSLLAIAATCGKAANAADGMPKSQSWRKRIGSGQGGHMVAA